MILVLCEGQNTEPQYLKGFERWCRTARVEVRIADERGTPMTLVSRAKELKAEAEDEARRERDDNIAFDEVWCVFDVDEHPDVPRAKDMARANGIRVAVSNPCFELWLLLHFRESPGMRHRHDVQRMMRDHVEGYDKHVDFESTFAPGYEAAVRRARRLEQDAADQREDGRNPTTGVWRLTESIRGNGTASSAGQGLPTASTATT